jgi:hypothetical protein
VNFYFFFFFSFYELYNNSRNTLISPSETAERGSEAGVTLVTGERENSNQPKPKKETKTKGKNKKPNKNHDCRIRVCHDELKMLTVKRVFVSRAICPRLRPPSYTASSCAAFQVLPVSKAGLFRVTRSPTFPFT